MRMNLMSALSLVTVVIALALGLPFAWQATRASAPSLRRLAHRLYAWLNGVHTFRGPAIFGATFYTIIWLLPALAGIRSALWLMPTLLALALVTAPLLPWWALPPAERPALVQRWQLTCDARRVLLHLTLHLFLLVVAEGTLLGLKIPPLLLAVAGCLSIHYLASLALTLSSSLRKDRWWLLAWLGYFYLRITVLCSTGHLILWLGLLIPIGPVIMAFWSVRTLRNAVREDGPWRLLLLTVIALLTFLFQVNDMWYPMQITLQRSVPAYSPFDLTLLWSSLGPLPPLRDLQALFARAPLQACLFVTWMAGVAWITKQVLSGLWHALISPPERPPVR